MRRRTTFSPGSSSLPGFQVEKRAGSGAWKISDFVDTAVGFSSATFFAGADLAAPAALVDLDRAGLVASLVAALVRGADSLAVAFFVASDFVDVSISSDFFLVTIAGALLTPPLASIAGITSRFGNAPYISH